MSVIGDKNVFAMEYRFFEETRDTEIAMYINNNNILIDFKVKSCELIRFE